MTGRTDELVSRTMVAGEIIRDTFRVKLDCFGGDKPKQIGDLEEQEAVAGILRAIGAWIAKNKRCLTVYENVMHGTGMAKTLSITVSNSPPDGPPQKWLVSEWESLDSAVKATAAENFALKERVGALQADFAQSERVRSILETRLREETARSWWSVLWGRK